MKYTGVITAMALAAIMTVIVVASPIKAQETAPAASTAAPSGASKEVLHKVREGEFLHMMASYYYGNSRLWTQIYENNKDKIKDPNHIRPGMLLKVEVPVSWEAPMPYDQWYGLAKEGAQGGVIDLGPVAEEEKEEEVVEAKMSVLGEDKSDDEDKGDSENKGDAKDEDEEVFE